MSDLSQLFALVGRGEVPPPDTSDLRLPQRIVWRHIVDGYEYVEQEDGEGRVTGANWFPLSGCANQPCVVRTSLTDSEARQAGLLFEGGGVPGGAAMVTLRHTVALVPSNVLYVRRGEGVAGSLYEVVSLVAMRDLFAREQMLAVRKVAIVPAEIRR